MKFFIYQRGKQSGPFTQEDMRLQLLSGDLKSGHLAWHSRLAEWTPISQLASVALLDEELSEPPDPKASSYYDALREEQTSPRRRTRRSTEESSRPRSRSRSASASSSATKAPPEEPPAPRRSESPQEERRVRRSSKPEPSPVPSPKEPATGLWGQIKAFFEN